MHTCMQVRALSVLYVPSRSVGDLLYYLSRSAARDGLLGGVGPPPSSAPASAAGTTGPAAAAASDAKSNRPGVAAGLVLPLPLESYLEVAELAGAQLVLACAPGVFLPATLVAVLRDLLPYHLGGGAAGYVQCFRA